VSYGPVGSLEEPEDPGNYSRFEMDGISLWISLEELESTDNPESLAFNFGQFNWCNLHLDMP
jgi:hypothetical protein